jgi:hypothetical protein
VKFDEVGRDGRLAGDAVRRSETEEQAAESGTAKVDSEMQIETEAVDPATLLGGRKAPEAPLPESSGSRLAEAWDD